MEAAGVNPNSAGLEPRAAHVFCLSTGPMEGQKVLGTGMGQTGLTPPFILILGGFSGSCPPPLSFLILAPQEMDVALRSWSFRSLIPPL